MPTLHAKAGDFMWLKQKPIQLHKIKMIILLQSRIEYQCECGAIGRNWSDPEKGIPETVVASSEKFKHCAHYDLCPECFPKHS